MLKPRYLFAFSLLLLALTSCSFNPGMQGKGEIYLQGEWQQDSVIKQQQLLNYSLYSFKFSCDSFFVEMRSYSKVNTGVDTCMNSGHWTEYIKGSYKQSNDTLRLKGLFCNADYSYKKAEGCFRSGVYEENFKVSKQTDSLIQFSSTSNVIPIHLHLTNRIICNPKPL
jgi:hypothetical protein